MSFLCLLEIHFATSENLAPRGDHIYPWGRHTFCSLKIEVILSGLDWSAGQVLVTFTVKYPKKPSVAL